MALVLLMASAAWAVGWYVTRPERLAGRLASAIASATGTEATIDSARYVWPGRVEIEGLRLALPAAGRDPASEAAAAAAAMAELFTAASATVTVDLSRAWSGRVALESIALREPTLTVVEDPATGVTNLERLQRLRADPDVPLTMPDRLPALSIRRGLLQRATVVEGERRLLGRMQLRGRLATEDGRKGVYRLELAARPLEPAATPAATPRWDELDPGDEEATELTGQIDLRRFAAALELERFELDPVQRALLPAELRAMWDRLDPAGTLPMIRLRFSPRLGWQPVAVEAEMRLDDVALTLPIDPLYRARMTGVAGTLVYRNDRLEVHDLRGDVEGVRYRLDGFVDARRPADRYDLRFATDRFEVPESPAIVPALPPEIEANYHRLSPSGAFRLDAHVQRDGRGEPIRYRGRVDVLGASVVYERFPYPAHDMTGVIRFSQDEVVIEHLVGTPEGGGRVEVAGRIAPPGDGAAVDMTVKLRGVPIGDALLAAMEPEHREALALLMHRPAMQRLVALGLVDPDAPVEPGSPTRDAPPYPFRLGGELNADVDVHRPLGDDARYLNTTTVYARGLGGLFEYFPLPAVGQSGSVRFNREAVTIDDVVARVPGGGTVMATGRITGHGDDDGPFTPDLRLTRATGRVNDLLLDALPDQQAEQIRRLGLTGDLAAEALIHRDAERDRIAFDVDVELANGRADPLGSGLVLQPLSGEIKVDNDGFDLAPIVAVCEDGRVEVTARWRRPRGDGEDRGDFRVRLVGRDMPVDDRLGGLVPDDAAAAAAWRDALSRLHPEGVTGFDARVRRPAAGPVEYAVALTPTRLAFDFNGHRFDLRDITGSARFEGGGLELESLAARSDDGTLGIDGLVDLSGDAGAALALSFDLQRIGPTTRALLPDPAIEAIDAVALAGAVSTDAARLRVTPRPADTLSPTPIGDTEPTAAAPLDHPFTGRPHVEFQAPIRFDGAAVDLGVAIENIHGRAVIDLATDAAEPDRPPRFALDFQGRHLAVLGRPVDRVELALDNASARDRLDVATLRGSAAGGAIVGRGYVDFAGPAPGYRLRLDLLEAELDPLMHPEDFTPDHRNTAGEPADPPAFVAAPLALTVRDVERGVVTASLSIDGPLDESADRRGRGALAVRNATLFDAPLGMAVLQSVNLALPDSRAFDRVACRWSLLGDTVTIDELTFETPTFAVTGAGAMTLPDTRLDLQMVTRVAGRQGLGKLGDAFNLFKDELIDIRITGTLDDPDTRLVSFQGLRNTWLRLFGLAPEPARHPMPIVPSR